MMDMEDLSNVPDIDPSDIPEIDPSIIPHIDLSTILDLDLSNIPDDINPNSPESSAPPQLSPPFDSSSFISNLNLNILCTNSGSNSPTSSLSPSAPQLSLHPVKCPSLEPQVKRGQVKIIRTGGAMHVMTMDKDGKPNISSYSRPADAAVVTSSSSSSKVNSSQHVSQKFLVPKRVNNNNNTSPFKSKRIDGENAITTISRYCYPAYHDSQLQNLTLLDILTQAKKVVSIILQTDCTALQAQQVQFLRHTFMVSDVGNIIMKDWELLRDIFDARHCWKLNQERRDRKLKRLIIPEVNYKRIKCFKSLPRHRTAQKRKDELKNYEAFVDLGERMDLNSLRRKLGKSNTFIVTSQKNQSASAARSRSYGQCKNKTSYSTKKKLLLTTKNLNGITTKKLNGTTNKKLKTTTTKTSTNKTRRKNRATTKLKRPATKPKRTTASRKRKGMTTTSSPDYMPTLEPEIDVHRNSNRLGPMSTPVLKAEFASPFVAKIESASWNHKNAALECTLSDSYWQLLENNHHKTNINGNIATEISPYSSPASKKKMGSKASSVLDDIDIDLEDISAELNFSTETERSNSLIVALHAGINSQNNNKVHRCNNENIKEICSEALSLRVNNKLVSKSDSGVIDDLNIDLEDIPGQLSFSSESSNSLIVALHAGMDSSLNNHHNSDNNAATKKNISEVSEDNKKMNSKLGSGAVHNKKAAAALVSTLTGSYWQAPENTCPANRPRRVNAGALMTTKSRSRGTKKEKVDETKKHSDTKRTIVGTSSKFISKKPYPEPITLEAMLVSEKTALKCVLSIPDTFVPTSHEEFLEQYLEVLDEKELFEMYKLIKGRSKTNCSSTSPQQRRFQQWRHSKLFITSRQRKLLLSPPLLHDNVTVKPKVEEIKTEDSAAASTTTVTTSPTPVSTLLRTVPQSSELTIKDEKNQEASPPRPRSSFHRKKFEEDEKTEYVKLGTNEILTNGVILIVDHVNYKREKDVDITYDDHEFPSDCPSSVQRPSVLYEALTNVQDVKQKNSLEEAVNSNNKSTEEMLNMNGETENIVESNSEAKCTLSYCALGCVCDSLKSDRGTREHCGKLKCMIDCSCQQGSSWHSDDIKSRLRPRVSLLNWSNRLNYPEAFSQDEDLLLSKTSNDPKGYHGRMKRTIVPPKRNSDFFHHSLAKKRPRAEDDSAKPSTRKVSRIFNAIGNRFRSLNQRLHAALTNENSRNNSTIPASSHNNIMRRVGLDKITKPAIQRAVKIQRNMALRPASQISQTQRYISKKSVEGTGGLIPPEYMAKMIPFMEIHARLSPSKTLPLPSETESSDGENDEEDVNTTHNMERFSNSLSFFTDNNEDSVVPVILSYRSCQAGCTEVVYPEKGDCI